jgi:hypothetical protein
MMAKAVIVELDVTIPDTEQNKVVTITIADPAPARTYTGKLTTILTYNPLPVLPASGKVTLVGPGLGAQ